MPREPVVDASRCSAGQSASSSFGHPSRDAASRASYLVVSRRARRRCDPLAIGDDGHELSVHSPSHTLCLDVVVRCDLRRRPGSGNSLPGRLSVRLAIGPVRVRTAKLHGLGDSGRQSARPRPPCPSSLRGEGTNERHLGPACRVRTSDRPRPEPSDHSRLSATVLLRQSDLGYRWPMRRSASSPHPGAVSADILGKSCRASPCTRVPPTPREHRGGLAARLANCGGISMSAFVMRTATGFRSEP